MHPRALVLNLYGGPGLGKSTCSALIFGYLKDAGVCCEYVQEFAKDLTWEKRHKTLSIQPYVTIKQFRDIVRVADEVDVVITDSPFVLGLAYPGIGSTPEFAPFVLSLNRLFPQWNLYLSRNKAVHPYVTKGRNQTEEEACAVDDKVRALLDTNSIPYEVITHTSSCEATARKMADTILKAREVLAPLGDYDGWNMEAFLSLPEEERRNIVPLAKGENATPFYEFLHGVDIPETLSF